MLTERRKKARVEGPFPLTVRGWEMGGLAYRFNTSAKNIGAGGLFATAPRLMSVGEKITILVRFALSDDRVQAPMIAARGRVVRVEDADGDGCSFAVAFLRHRFVWRDPS